LGHAGEGHLVGAVGCDVIGNLALGQALRLDHQRHFLGLVAEADDIARHDPAAGDVALHAVDADVAVADDLARGEDRRRELGTVDDHVEPLLEQADQVLAGVALHAIGFLVGPLELLLGDVAVVALELLLGAQLQAVVAHLALAALAVLARAVGTAVHGAVRTAPDVLAHPAVEFMLGALALRHESILQFAVAAPVAALQPGIAPTNLAFAAAAASPGCGANCERRPWPLEGEKSTPLVAEATCLRRRRCSPRPGHHWRCPAGRSRPGRSAN